ncbi:MAG: NAD(P)-dependent oxidoreductase, partial [Pseudomonadota bacterium]
VVVLRPGCIYGGGSPQWSTRIARLLRERRIGDLGADGDGICNAVHVVDVARAVAAALTTPGIAGEVFNLAMAPPPTWNGYFLAYAKALGAVPLQRIGARRLKIETKLLAPVLKIAEIVGKKAGLGADRFPPPIPPSLLRLWRQEIRLEAGKAQRVLGVTWMGLEEGLSSAARSPG